MKVGEILASLREERKIGQKELAVYLNVSIGTISNYEHNCSATRFLRNADRINEKNEAGKITSQPRSFWPRSRHCPAADRTILRPTRIHYTRRKWPASAGSCHNGITSPYRS